MSGNVKFPNIDWRFNEFPNPAVYALYMTCAEIMALPLAPAVVANNIIDVVMQRYIIFQNVVLFKKFRLHFVVLNYLDTQKSHLTKYTVG